MAEDGSAILLFGNDVCNDARDAYERWHANHHVPQRLTVAGIFGAIRFRNSEPGSPEYLTLYRLRDADVLESAAYRALIEQPDPPTRAMRANLLRPRRFIAQIGGVPRIPEGFAMGAAEALEPFENQVRQAEICITGPLVANQLNHPIMGRQPLPEGFLQLRFARAEQLTGDLARGAVPIGGLYRQLDRFGWDQSPST